METNIKFKIYSNTQKPLNINSITIKYKTKDSIGLRSFKIKKFKYDTLERVYYNNITNNSYLKSIHNNNIDYVLIEYDIDKVDDNLNFVDYNSLLATYNIKEDNKIVKLKYIYQLKLDIISDNSISNVLSSIESVTYFSNDKEILNIKLNAQSINKDYQMIIDVEFDELPESFIFNFINNEKDALISFDVYQLGTLISMNRTHRHITKRHYFNRNIQDNQYLMLDFIDVCNVKNVNNEINIQQIDFIRVFYKDNSNDDIYTILNRDECIFFSTKFGDIKSIEIYWKQEYLQNKLYMIDIYRTDIISSKYRTLLKLFNPDKITKITKLDEYSMDIKVAIIQKWCAKESTMISVSLSLEQSDNMVIYDVDVNHIFKTYDFKYFCSYEKDGLFYHLYMSPSYFPLTDINFIGLKYYFLDISIKYYINVEIFNITNVSIKDVSLSGRSFNAVIPLDYTLENDEKIAYKYMKSLNLYNNVKDLPSEYVKYGRYEINEKKSDNTYIDIDLTLSRTFDGDFNILFDNQVIMQSLYNLFLSIKNDRPLKPWLEANLRNRLFDIEGNLLKHILKTYIDSYISQVEPRVKIHSLDTLYIDNNYNTLKIIIIFSILENSYKLPFSFDIQVEQ
jgi:hypothetical protein